MEKEKLKKYLEEDIPYYKWEVESGIELLEYTIPIAKSLYEKDRMEDLKRIVLAVQKQSEKTLRNIEQYQKAKEKLDELK